MKVLHVKINEKSTGVFMVDLSGPIDTYTHELFNHQIEAILVPSTKAIALNMAGVDYVSSMGIGSIFKIRQFAKTNTTTFAIVNLQPQVKKVFDTVQAMPKEAVFSNIAELDAYLDRIQKQ
jgi:anti-sigma B factor antagonist